MTAITYAGIKAALASIYEDPHLIMPDVPFKRFANILPYRIDVYGKRRGTHYHVHIEPGQCDNYVTMQAALQILNAFSPRSCRLGIAIYNKTVDDMRRGRVAKFHMNAANPDFVLDVGAEIFEAIEKYEGGPK